MTTTLDLSATPPLAPEHLQQLLGQMVPALLQQLGGLLALKDLQSQRYVYVNDAMASLMRRTAADVVGRVDAELFAPSLLGPLRVAEQASVSQAQPLTSEHQFESGGERRVFTVLRVASAPDRAGRRWLCSVWNDLAPDRQREAQLRLALEQIEQQQRANDLLRSELSDQAVRDPASGLHRRVQFEDQLRREVDLSMREHREFAVVFIELDPPQAKVKALGVAGQQRVLEALGRLLSSGTRAMDAACRYDERRFAVLLSGVGLATAHSRMEGLRRKCATQIVVHEGQDLGFSVAMGVASFPHTAQTQEALLEACEAALSEARRRGGNHVTLAAIRFDPA